MKLFLDLAYAIPQRVRIALEIAIGVALIVAAKS